ncbi:MAG TPA: hypothetical protein VN648_09050, partial [Candidatus Methylomirabilis sp.]|nr:hypothetical protein [Candidatus Methylomirabilis sp.]
RFPLLSVRIERAPRHRGGLIFAPALLTIKDYRRKLNPDFNLDLESQGNLRSDNIPLETY